ncbi:deoxyribose-phosphate aldolase [Polaribacter sp. WD7]|uniref:DUF6503 family protein n=1 Tax=Polaribacter sp. WD7 TaxID=2269061 RepID=UPI000DF4067D|nr:DUF6503 family protein [Polaribacter sp. WD7]RCS27275.1 deoxyribose-phosphate aldolase [Polaribacter sp. WD7]
MRYFLLVFSVLIFSCNPQKNKIQAENIIDQTIIYSGSNRVSNSDISFVFRDKFYTAVRAKGNFTLTRSFDDIKDVLTNNGFTRFVNGSKVDLSQEDIKKYTGAVNSVHYFSVLPHGLHDEAVHKKLLANTTIKGEDYFKIQITFDEDGGGEDHQDVFIYWVGKEDYLIDYFAYSYEVNGGGIRFRAIKNENYIGGIRFVDYYNYKPKNNTITLQNIDKAFVDDELEMVSEIVLEKVNVKPFY